jgi:hypothetical protein
VSAAGYVASREELLALAAKYQTLLAWRREHAEQGAIADRALLRALSQKFPGALRELDSVPLDVIEARIVQLTGAAQGSPVEPWMNWMVAYHQLMRAALWLKPRLMRPGKPGEARLAADWLEALSRAEVCSVPLPISFVAAVASPPSGRLNALVFELLGRAFQLEPGAIRQALFPARPR